VLRALSMQVRPAASSCWPAARRGPADPASACASASPRHSLGVQRCVVSSSSPPTGFRPSWSDLANPPLSLSVFCFVSSEDLHIGMPPKSRLAGTAAGAQASATTPLPAPTPPPDPGNATPVTLQGGNQAAPSLPPAVGGSEGHPRRVHRGARQAPRPAALRVARERGAR